MLLLRKIFSLSTLTLFTALALSSIAAWYSIVGLTAIFAAAAIPVIIMGAALETAKVVTTMWLHKFWKGSGILIKLYLIPAVIVLALITSMGIFGFLSKAHLEQAKPAGNNVAKIERIDLQIEREKRTIKDAEKIIAQLDQTVQVLMDAQRIRGPDGALAVRRGQQSERDNLTDTINKAQATVDKLEDEKFELNIAVRDLKLEVGPIKYVAALIYEDAESNLENAVRIVILLLVVVFDPLALCLVIAALKAKQIENLRYEELKKEVKSIPVTEVENKEPVEEVIEEKYSDQGPCYKCGTLLLEAPGIGPFCPNKDCDVFDGPFEESLIEKTIESFESDHVSNEVIEPDDVIEESISEVLPEQESVELISEEIKKKEDIVEDIPVEQTETTYKEVDGGYVVYEDKLYKKEALQQIKPDLFAIRPDTHQSSSTGFGIQFPRIAFKGDIFVRVDVLPNKVYKFDGHKWIEVNKSMSDSYLYDMEYIKYLIEKISKGEYDIELLSDNERHQIEEYLSTTGDKDK